jgi:excisionase family DNA binding protein
MPTVYRRVADGQLPAVRIGATIRIPLSAVEHLEHDGDAA